MFLLYILIKRYKKYEWQISIISVILYDKRDNKSVFRRTPVS